MDECCGSSPEFIRALALMLREDKEDVRNNLSRRARSEFLVAWTGGISKYQTCRAKMPPGV